MLGSLVTPFNNLKQNRNLGREPELTDHDTDDYSVREQICSESLTAIEYARAAMLMRQGVSPETARMFAPLESSKRNEVAEEIYAEAALLAKLEHFDDGDMGFHCELIPDQDLPDLWGRFFGGFCHPIPNKMLK